MKEKKKEFEDIKKSLTDGKLEEAISGITEIVKTINTGSTGKYVEREHLDKQIKDITDRNTPFYDNLRKVKANGITHEWDMVTSLGTNHTAVAECGTPVSNESTITRYSAQVKTYATRVEVCDKAQWGASDYVDLMNLHLEGGMRKILQDIEKVLFYGDTGVTAEDFDGVYKLVSDNAVGNIVDGAAGPITEALVDAAIQKVIDNGGIPSDIYMAADDLRHWASLWADKVVINDPGKGITTGYTVARYMSFAGVLDITMDLFINDTNSPNANADVFVLTQKELAIAEAHKMYKLPVYRGLTLATTQTVVYEPVLEMKVPQWQAIVKNVAS